MNQPPMSDRVRPEEDQSGGYNLPVPSRIRMMSRVSSAFLKNEEAVFKKISRPSAARRPVEVPQRLRSDCVLNGHAKPIRAIVCAWAGMLECGG